MTLSEKIRQIYPELQNYNFGENFAATQYCYHSSYAWSSGSIWVWGEKMRTYQNPLVKDIITPTLYDNNPNIDYPWYNNNNIYLDKLSV